MRYGDLSGIVLKVQDCIHCLYLPQVSTEPPLILRTWLKVEGIKLKTPLCTEIDFFPRSRFGEVCLCCSQTVLPGPAWGTHS